MTPPGLLRADCGRCFGLCCVAHAFVASADFAIDKEDGEACPHLQPDFRCGIHRQLRQRGFPGCAAYDCIGAGQRVAQVTFGGQDWRRAPYTAHQMLHVFTIMRELHQLLWYLSEALTLPPARALHDELRAALDETERLAAGSAAAVASLDVAAHRREVDALLLRTSELVRASAGATALDRQGADLTGARLESTDLRGANLRETSLVAASLQGVDLRWADLYGADLSGADIRGADLGESIFLVQSQIDVARGDSSTRLPRSLARPWRWPTAAVDFLTR